MKKSIAAILLLLMLMVPVACGAQASQRIAILPVYSQAYIEDDEAKAIIQDSLYQWMQDREGLTIIPGQEIVAFLPAEVQKGKKRVKLDKKSLPELATQLNADWILVADIADYSKLTTFTFGYGTTLNVDLQIRISLFNRQSGTLIEKKDYDTFSSQTTGFDEREFVSNVVNRIMKKIVPAM